jgi:ribosome-associated heat shock protein Hsp15
MRSLHPGDNNVTNFSLMPGSEKIRIDKFLWAVRIFKTRSLASEACRKGRIIINNIQVKPSRVIEPNEIITVKKLPVLYTYEIIHPIENRVSAKLVGSYLKDLTPEDEKSKLILSRTSGFGLRPKGFGRPTKKERRTIDRLNETNTDL